MRVTIISPFAIKNSGHSLVDDQYIFKFMIESKKDFLFYTSSYSIKQISQANPGNESVLRDIKSDKISLYSNERVVFLGFSEISVFRFLIKNFIYSPKIVLMATNNFSNGRVKKYFWFLKAFLLMSNYFIEKIIIHTSHEKKLLKILSKSSSKKTFIKRYHGRIKQEVIPKMTMPNKKIISLYGPIKPDKPLEPFIELIKMDTDSKFVYRIYGLDRMLINEKISNLESKKNIELFPQRLAYNDYLDSYKSSTLIFLNHSNDFEGKTSGNLNDCISLAVPYISRSMQPMLEYEGNHGPLGYLCNYDDPDWAMKLLNEINNESLSNVKRNIEIMRSNYTKENVYEDLHYCLIEY